MFNKKQNNEEQKKNYEVAYENLAVPEVHTEEGEAEAQAAEEGTEPISYVDAAIPEIHIRKKK